MNRRPLYALFRRRFRGLRRKEKINFMQIFNYILNFNYFLSMASKSVKSASKKYDEVINYKISATTKLLPPINIKSPFLYCFLAAFNAIFTDVYELPFNLYFAPSCFSSCAGSAR